MIGQIYEMKTKNQIFSGFYDYNSNRNILVSELAKNSKAIVISFKRATTDSYSLIGFYMIGNNTKYSFDGLSFHTLFQLIK